jgi:hypothetical protein
MLQLIYRGSRDYGICQPARTIFVLDIFPMRVKMAPAWRPETRFSQKEPPPLDHLPFAVLLIGTSIWRVVGA